MQVETKRGPYGLHTRNHLWMRAVRERECSLLVDDRMPPGMTCALGFRLRRALVVVPRRGAVRKLALGGCAWVLLNAAGLVAGIVRARDEAPRLALALLREPEPPIAVKLHRGGDRMTGGAA